MWTGYIVDPENSVVSIRIGFLSRIDINCVENKNNE